MPKVGFEPTIPVFERANIFHALDRAATVISDNYSTRQKTTCCYELAGLPRLLQKSSSNPVLSQLNPVYNLMTQSISLRKIIIISILFQLAL
jgi:hypothetical protein